jgi:hypothetical protein
VRNVLTVAKSFGRRKQPRSSVRQKLSALPAVE